MQKSRVILTHRASDENERDFCRSECRLARGGICWDVAEHVTYCHGCGELSEVFDITLIF